MKKSIARAIRIALILACILGFIGYQKANEEKIHVVSSQSEQEGNAVVATEARIAQTSRPVLDCKSLEAACAEGFIDPSKVTVLGGEWAYTAEPDKFVSLATVRYTTKDNEYETADFVMVGVLGGKIELYHGLNEHSPYNRENVLQEFGAIDDQRFPLE